MQKRHVKMCANSLVILLTAGSLAGCGQSELRGMLRNGDMIEIEVAIPKDQEQGTPTPDNWIALDQLTTLPDLRSNIDDLLKIRPLGDSKSGVIYIDLDGKQCGNNTLYNGFMNRNFRKYWEDDSFRKSLSDMASQFYIDIDASDEPKAITRNINMALAGYYNLFNDTKEGYANPDSTLTRMEAMGAIYKADTPVNPSITIGKSFQELVDPANTNEDAIYASQILDDSYLDITSKSLNNLTANGNMTRAEAVYMLVSRYYKDEMSRVDLSASSPFSDLKNGGDIATLQKFITTDKKTKQLTQYDYWKSYELVYALQNPDDGAPQELYKALIVASNHNIIPSGGDSRWDEAITASELMDMIINTYLSLPTIIAADQGITDEVYVEEIIEEPVEEVEVDSTGEAYNFQEGDYVEESDDEEGISDAEYEKKKAIIDKKLEDGEIPQERYDTLMDLVERTRKGKGGLKGMADKVVDDIPKPTPSPQPQPGTGGPAVSGITGEPIDTSKSGQPADMTPQHDLNWVNVQ